MVNVGLLLLRVTVGSLVAGHGAQKLFGWFEGPGVKNTGQFMEKLGLKPARFWGPIAALGEFTGGLFTALGFMHPVGPQNIMGAMAIATRRAHWKLPVWTSAGGAELAATNFAVAAALATLGPGKYSADRLFGIKLPKWMVVMSWLNLAAVVAYSEMGPEKLQDMFDRVTGGGQGAYTGPADSESHANTEFVTERRPRVEETADTAEEKIESTR